MKNPKSFFLGCLICLYALNGLSTGITYFPKKHNSGFWEINRYDDFAAYWVITSILIYIGIHCIRAAFIQKTPKPNLEQLTFKDINEYNNFKRIEKLLSTAPFIWGVVGFIVAFPFWYLLDYNFNLATNDCGICKIDEDWSNLILASSVIIFPVIFFKLSFKIMINRFLSNGIISAPNLKHLRIPIKTKGEPTSSDTISYSSDSGGDCGGE